MSRRLLILLALILAAVAVSGCCCCCGDRRYYGPETHPAVYPTTATINVTAEPAVPIPPGAAGNATAAPA